LRRYTEVLETSVAEETVLPVFFALLRDPVWAVRKAGRCRLTVLKPVLKEPMVSAISA